MQEKLKKNLNSPQNSVAVPKSITLRRQLLRREGSGFTPASVKDETLQELPAGSNNQSYQKQTRKLILFCVNFLTGVN